MDKNQKIALVSGGNRGIGKAICTQLVHKGYAVIVGCRDLKKGQEAIAEMQNTLSAGAYPQACLLDLNSEESIGKAVEWIEKEYGRLDLLVNNAAVLPNSDSLLHVGIDTVETTMRNNVYGPLMLIQKTLPLLRRSDDARIINVSSGMGSFAEAARGYAAYRLSKAALNFLTFTLSKDLQMETRIKVFAACPGWVKTDMGGANAPGTTDEGAASVLWPALNSEAKSGAFYRDGKMLNW